MFDPSLLSEARGKLEQHGRIQNYEARQLFALDFPDIIRGLLDHLDQQDRQLARLQQERDDAKYEADGLLASASERQRKLDAAESQLAQLRAERAWQPIETAPKDGTSILLFNGAAMWIGWWKASVSHAAWRDHEWRVFSPEPTHWMPLPLAPEGPADPVQQPRSDADSSK